MAIGLYLCNNYAQCVLDNFQYGTDHRTHHVFMILISTWRNMKKLHRYTTENMQVIFIMILHVWGCNSPSYLTLHYQVWSTNVSKYKPIWIGQPDQLIQPQVKSFIFVFLVYWSYFFLHYNHISSILKNY